MKDALQMKYQELKSWLRDRLQMQGDAALDINTRIDESPYERPVKLLKTETDDFRYELKRAILDLVAEAGAQPWKPEHFHELAMLLEAANFWEAVGPLEDIVHSRKLLAHESGAQLHMLTLRTLLALGWKGTPDFWRSQKELVGQRWPGIIFEGLVLHDIRMGFEALPELVASQEAMREVLNLFPGLMLELKASMTTWRDECRRIVDKLPVEAADAMREWFRMRGFPVLGLKSLPNLDPPEELRLALRNYWNEPISLNGNPARLCPAATPELAAA
jgi:hypothetical protein